MRCPIPPGPGCSWRSGRRPPTRLTWPSWSEYPGRPCPTTWPACAGAAWSSRSLTAGGGAGGDDHGQGHAPGGTGSHAHGPAADADRRYLLIALVLLAAFMLGEVIVAVVSGSLALLSDAGHMLSDVGAIGAALWAIRLAARPAAGSWTFGWKRAEILSAAGNGITLLVVSGIVAFEAIRRLIHPPAVQGGPVLIVALVGVVVNIAAAWV